MKSFNRQIGPLYIDFDPDIIEALYETESDDSYGARGEIWISQVIFSLEKCKSV